MNNEQDILIKIEEEIARLLNKPAQALDFEASFLELGIDSQLGVDLVEGLSKKLGIRLGPEVIFDYRGPVELAQHIVAAYRDQVKAPEAGRILEVPAAPTGIKVGGTHGEDIAIIGISGRFADSEDVEEYWQHLEKGHCCIKEIHRHEWQEAVYYDPNSAKANKSVSKWGGFLKRIDTFDPLFFSISPREAERMDPQQRLFLEESIKAFEESGYSPEALAGQKIGVFVGCRGMDYQQQALLKRDIDSQFFLGNDMAILSGRVSYHLNLKGPNITIDAACSSSLAAIHLACESIHQGESELALAGGVFLLPSPQFFIMASKAEMLSPRGKCRTFNEEADGMVVGEGVGTLVLKPLKKAREDNDHIYGVIKGSGMNHNGRTQGITAPSTIPQKELITHVCFKANINPSTVTYTEIQGTGSALGDPIEFKALTEAFRVFTDKKQFCAMGSHTPNMGHTMNAAGMAGVFKILLAMKHKTIPPFIGLDKINKNILFQDSPFYINTTTQPWRQSNDQPLRAGVGTFAFNGSNCYLIIEEPPMPDDRDIEIKSRSPRKPNYLIPLSAKTQASLQQKLADLAAWLDKEMENPSPFLSIENITYTLQVGRSHFPFRCIWMVKDIHDLRKKIEEILERGSTTGYVDNLPEPRNQAKENWTSSQKYLFKEVAKKLIDEMQESGCLSENSIKEKLLALADLYVSGYDLDWEALSQNEKGAYHRLSLPAYPFAREQYWIGGGYQYNRNKQKPDQQWKESGEGKKTRPSILEIAIDRKKQPLMDSDVAARVEKGLEEVQTLAYCLVLTVFQRMGVFQQGDESYGKEQLKQQLKIIPLYSRLFEGLLDILGRAGFIRPTAGPDKGDLEINTTPKLKDSLLKRELDRKNLENTVNRLLEDYPEIRPYTRLLWVTHQEYPGILKGDIPATDVMFPHYSMELMEGIYRGNYTADYYNQLTAWAVVSYIRTQLPMLSKGEKIKILEIGAGTGGTSAVVFDAIRPYADQLVYVYTDISAGFTRYGKKQYEAKNPFVVFKVLDIEKEITGQGYEPGDFDILIATNVLHATRSISQTLAKARILLKKNGWLMANELTSVLDIYTINFGLLEGWWLFEDKTNRLPDSPLLSPDTWQRLLQQEGFDHVLLLGHPAPNEGCISQHVIIGEYSSPAETREKTMSKPLFTAAAAPKQVCTNRHSNLNPEEKELHRQVEDQILDILAEILEINKKRLNPEVPHTDFGVDSILAIEIIERINQELGIHLKSPDLFNYPTVKRLTGYILETSGNLFNLPGDPDNGRKQIESRLLEILASHLHIDQKELDLDTPFTDFGMDTLTANRVVTHLNEELGTLLTAFDLINHINLRQLTAYIVNRWGESLKESPVEAGEDLLTHRDKPGYVDEPCPPGPWLYDPHREESQGDTMRSMAIAVIGMAARCPGAQDIDEFWQNLTTGKDSIREVNRWKIDSFFDPDPQTPGKCNCKWGGFLSDIDAFDPLFFNISPKEAELMDPQHRLFLEEAWKALEDAGYSDKDLEEARCGVFVGFNLSDYQGLLERKGVLPEAYTFTGNHEAILSARLSYFLNLKGPGITINTACSASLAAVHLACESICCGTSDIAIAGGAQVMNTPELYIKTGRAGMLSPVGQCKTFDNSADGFVPAEGVGVVVLKPLPAARHDKDHIYGIIVASGINQDGKTSGITAPSAPSQTQLECQVYDRYNIDPGTITYVEAHGTGTRLGDPIEIDALTTAFKKYTSQKQFCAIGSVKTNIGHTGAAAGITGLIKTLLCLKNKQLVPSIHFQKENEFINFKESPFYVNTRVKHWEPPQQIPRTAAVSSLGFSGTNAHLVLQEAPRGTGGLAFLSVSPLSVPSLSIEQPSKTLPYYLIPISAKTRTTLEQKFKDMITWLETKENYCQLRDISYTLLVGRSHFSHRSVVLVKTTDGTAQLLTQLRIILEEKGTNNRKGTVWENYLTDTQQDPQFKPSPALEQFGEALIRELQEYRHINPTLIESEYRRKLLAVADLYTRGYDLDWRGLYQDEECTRVSLPTYPFAKGRYWIPGELAPVRVQEIPAHTYQLPLDPVNQGQGQDQAGEDFFYMPSWQPEPLAHNENTPSIPRTKKEKQRVFFFYYSPTSQLKKVLAQAHIHRKDEVIDMEVGPMAVNTTDFEKYIHQFQLQGIPLIYFLGGILEEDIDKDADEFEMLDQSQERGVISLFRLVKFLISQGFGQKPLELKVITNDVFPVLPGVPVKPYAASLHGLVRSLAREYPRWEISCIDISLEEVKTNRQCLEDLARQVLYEPAHTRGEAAVIRRGMRYVRILRPTRFPGERENPFKHQGLYLILGGAGGIGLELGHYLARTVQAKLVLVGRKPQHQLSPQQEEKISRIRAAGSKVLYIQSNAADLESMQTAAREAKSQLGKINGIIHSAIVLEDKSLANMDEETFRAVLAPKVRGSVVLHHIFRDESLDFMIFFSSAQSFIGNPGQSNYAAACTFKDSYALHLSRVESYPVKIINWGYWGSVGIVANQEYNRRLEAQGMQSIQPQEGMEAVRSILGNEAVQVMAVKADTRLLQEMGVNLHRPIRCYPQDIPSCIERVVKRVTGKLPGSSGDLFQRTYGKVERFGQCLLLQTFRQMGVFNRGKKQYDKERLTQELGITANYLRLWDALLDILERIGFIEITDGTIITSSQPDDPGLKKELDSLEETGKRLALENPAVEPHIRLLKICMEAYPQILTGRRNHMEVMFPGGSRGLVEKIYKGNESIDYYNRMVANIVRSCIEIRLRQNPAAAINILEVGAGTGGTSAFVLEEIKEFHQNINYYYTDISGGFTRRGQEEYGKTYGFTRFKVLDIEKDPVKQGFQPDSLDMVFASNVLHATRYMTHTLDQVKKLLKTNGIVVINEITHLWDFATLTFGLTDGWWLYEDEENRIKGSPLLGPGKWQELLAAHGFRKIRILGTDEEIKQQRQGIFAAESNGWVEMESGSLIPLEMKSPAPPPAVSVPGGDLRERVREYVKEVFSRVLKIEKTTIDSRSTFENYGVDSLVTLDINKEFGKYFENLSSTLLFEYTTIEALTDYFIKNHGPVVEDITGITPVVEMGQDPGAPRAVKDSPEQTTGVQEQDIAIIGLSGRYPQSPTLAEFWENLKKGRDCIGEIPPDRWNRGDEEEGEGYQWGGFIEDADRFDSLFFNISPAEARGTDPQERLFLETAWELFEDAGITRETLARMNHRIGVFVGVMNRDYEWYHAIQPGSSIANRVSYFFNLQGPSLAIDASCASSLTALHLACNSIRRGECEMAVVGGVNLILHPGHYSIMLSKNMLSGVGRCNSFGEGADGFVVGEGVGAVLLKPLDRAKQDRDNIYALVKGTAVNAGGKTGGYTVPNPNAQAKLVGELLHKVRIDPRTISYIEAQATGSMLGDPIEMAGLTKAFREFTPGKQYCAIGSVKSNIGHLESAAGIASLTKVLLQMKYKQLVPSLHCTPVNPKIDFVHSPFYVQKELSEWNPIITEKGIGRTYPRRAGISCFAAQGANAHVILEEYETSNKKFCGGPGGGFSKEPPGRRRQKELILLSAKNEDRLRAYAGKMVNFLEKQINHISLTDIAYTLQVGREPMEERLAVIAANNEELKSRFNQFKQGYNNIQGLYHNNVKISGEKQEASPQDIEKAIKDRNFNQLARVWVSGVEIQWERLYPHDTPRRISLPNYPFLRKRHWVERPGHFQDQELPGPPKTLPFKTRKSIESAIIRSLTDVLEMDSEEFDINTPFTDFGVDSVFAVGIISGINKKLGINLRSTDLFNYPTIGKLTLRILEQVDHGVYSPSSPVTPGKISDRRKRNLHQGNREYREQSQVFFAAVIGMSARFPDAGDTDEFWNNLASGKNSVREITRWNTAEFYDPNPRTTGKNHCKWGGFLSDIDTFDPLFFNISPKEAELMDPQQRIFLEQAWKALEDAGYCGKEIEEKKCGVFVGFTASDYERLLEANNLDPDAYTLTGNSESILASRISYFLNLKGPSITVNTACSSSLVSIHLAYESIRAGTSEMAIAGGVQVMTMPKLYIKISKSGMASVDGKCKVFDNQADGFVPGEGAGAVLLKPLEAAVKDRDHIYGIIIASGLNQDGKTNGITAPSAASQTQLELEVYRRCGIHPDTITYIEAHGTGTKLGDPIEVDALKDTFAMFDTRKQYCALGSVKTNIGHTLAAAGVAGFIKVLLCLKHQTLVPSLHFKQPNEHVNFKDSPFYVNTQLQEWKVDTGVPRRAAISSFGFSGTNAHMVVEECLSPCLPKRVSSPEPQIVVLSARNEERLKVYTEKMSKFLEKAAYMPKPGDDLLHYLQSDLLKIAAEIIDVEENNISLEEDLEEYGFDAVKLAAFIQRLEEMYNLEINPGILQGNTSVRLLSQYLGSQYADILADFYSSGIGNNETTLFLPDIAYTLQVGREAMEARLALVASTLQELKEKLTQYLDQEKQGKTMTGTRDFYCGNIAGQKATSDFLSEGRESKEFIRILIDDRNLDKLGRLWVSGVDIPWDLLHSGSAGHPRRISLPTYPFLNERYWVPINTQIPYEKPFEQKQLHPLIDGISPGLSLDQGIVFRKTLKETDPVVRDHQVHEQCIFPGVGYLEMGAAVGMMVTGGTPCQLAHVLWQEPLLVQEENKQVHIVVKANDQDLLFQVQSYQGSNTVTHAAGQLHGPVHSAETPPLEQISIEEIKARCPYYMDKTALYYRTGKMGVNYGTYFQGVTDVWSNPHEAVSKFCLPGQCVREWSGYTLHPAVMDSALQTIVGIFAAEDPDSHPQVVPFSVAKVVISHPLPTIGCAHAITTAPLRYDVVIMDENGTVCLKFHHVAFRPFKKTSLDFLYMPTWKPVRLPAPQNRPSIPGKQKVLILYPHGESVLKPALANAHGKDEVIAIHWDPANSFNLEKSDIQSGDIRVIYFLGGIQVEDIDIDDMDVWEQTQERGVLSLFRLVKFLILHGYAQRALRLKVITNDVLQVTPGALIKPFGASLHGMVKSMAKEYPGWEISCIDVSLEEIKTNPQRVEELVRQIRNEPGHPGGDEVAIREGKRYVRTIEPLVLPAVSQTPFKHQGVYFILGGAGGIGLETGLYLARTVQARLVIIGRTPEDQLIPKQKEKIAQIRSGGGTVLYIQANAADLESMKNAVQKAKSHFGKINGVFHSAIVLKDKTLQNMEEETFRTALQPKVKGSLILHHVFKEEEPDFMVFYSAGQSFAGNPGQSNYAAGCTFKDAFALYLHHCGRYPVKIINWGYWGSVGIVATETYNKRLKEQGLRSIEPGEGMEAVQRILSHRVTQVMPLKAHHRYLEKIGIDTNYYREVYPEHIPSVLARMVSHISLPSYDMVEVHRYGEAYKEMVRCIPRVLLYTFREMGVFAGKGEHHRQDELQKRLGILPGYTRLYNGLIQTLANADLIRRTGDEIVTGPLLDSPGIRRSVNINAWEKEKDRLMTKFPEIAPHIRLLWACFKNFPHVLTGQKNHMEVMFPGGSKSLVEGVYQGTPLSDYFHRLAAQLVGQYIRQRLQSDAEAQIHILEVGAGTGGTSHFVLETVNPYADHLRYWYTDISSGFTRYGKEKFAADYPFVEFQVLDIEQPVERQGFKPNSIDLVLGSNVLHATRQMAQTLHHVKRLLKTNGVIVINEVTHVEEFALLTFGLTKGWWRFEDEEIRLPGSPLLGCSQWKELLETNGIRQVHIFQFPDAAVKEFGQSVMVGESDGNVRVPAGEPEPGLEAEPGVEPEPEPGLAIGKPPGPTPHFEPVSKKSLQENLLDYVKTVFCDVLKIQEQRLDSSSTFERYGVDSLVSIDIIHRFEKDFGKLPATLLFENMTLGKLADYFLSQHGQRAAQLFNRRETPGRLPPSSNHTAPTPKTGKKVMETPLDPFPLKGNESLTDKVLQLSDHEVDELLQLLSNL
jgi:acyl transferase domain-containing protein/acyl carrier protein/SAM-dependent methyltransferase